MDERFAFGSLEVFVQQLSKAREGGRYLVVLLLETLDRLAMTGAEECV